MNQSGSRHDEGVGVESTAVLPQGDLGAWLRTQREARGVTLREIADASKISLRHLEALEHDRFDALPAPVFVRGFLREYARVVGLDPDEVVNLYLMAAAERSAADEDDVDRETSNGRVAPSPIGYGILVAAVIVVLLAIAAAVSFWVGRRSSSEELPARTEAATEADASASGTSEENFPAASAVEAETDPGAASTGVVGAPAAAARPPAAGEAGAVTGAEPGSAGGVVAETFEVELEFLQDCWVEVVLDGKRRPSELKAGGEVLVLEARDSVVLTLGNAPAVRVAVDGRALALPSDRARVLHGYRIDRSTLAALRASGAAAQP